MKRLLPVIAVVFTLELVVLVCTRAYGPTLFEQVRLSVITKIITGAQIISPVFVSMFDALLQMKN